MLRSAILAAVCCVTFLAALWFFGRPVLEAPSGPSDETVAAAPRTDTLPPVRATRANDADAAPAVRVSIPTVEPPAAIDAEWLALPRSRRDAVPALLRAPQSASAVRLLRSTTCNPRDVLLADDTRRAVAATIAEAVESSEEFAAAWQKASDQELADLRARGLARAVPIDTLEGLLQMEQLGPEREFRTIDGVTYAVDRAGMPRSRALQETLEAEGSALVQRLTTLFAAAGALSAGEAQALSDRAIRSLRPAR